MAGSDNNGLGGTRKPYLLPKAEMTVAPMALPGSDVPGYTRNWRRGVRTDRSFARIIELPAGQATPIHAVTCDHIIYGVEGVTTFQIEGEAYRVGPGDLLFFPANALYLLCNETSELVSFLSIGVEADSGWPAQSNYWPPDAPDLRRGATGGPGGNDA